MLSQVGCNGAELSHYTMLYNEMFFRTDDESVTELWLFWG